MNKHINGDGKSQRFILRDHATANPMIGNKPKGHFPSRKNDRTFPWCRQIDREFMRLLEVDPDVRAWSYRTRSLAVFDGGVVAEHVVDFEVRSVRGRELTDIVEAPGKPADDMYKMVGSHLAAKGERYVTVPVAEIRLQPRLTNAETLLTAQHLTPPMKFLIDLQEAQDAHHPATLGDLEDLLAHWPDVRWWLYAASLRGHLLIDLMERPLGRASVVAVPK